ARHADALYARERAQTGRLAADQRDLRTVGLLESHHVAAHPLTSLRVACGHHGPGGSPPPHCVGGRWWCEASGGRCLPPPSLAGRPECPTADSSASQPPKKTPAD